MASRSPDDVDPSLPTVVLLHGWPGDHNDYRRVVPLLEGRARAVCLDLAGFGEAYQGPVPDSAATNNGQASFILDRMRELGLQRTVIAGYDIGSLVAQTIARQASEAVSGLVITPGYAGIPPRDSDPALAAIKWYQHFNRLPFATEVLDGDERAIAAYLRYAWSTWSRDETLTTGPEFEALVAQYSRPGALHASLAYYRNNDGYPPLDQGSIGSPVDYGPIRVPTTMLWPAQDMLFPTEWSDLVPEWFADVNVHVVPDCGHFVPLEAPAAFANAILKRLA